MKKSCFFILLGVLLGGYAGAFAAGEPVQNPGADKNFLGLEGAISEARQNSPDLKQAASAVAEADWKRLEAASPHIPHLQAGANQVLDTKYAYLGVYFGPEAIEFPSAMPSTTVDLEASWMIFDGLGSVRAYQAAALNYQAAQAGLQRADFQLAQNIRLRFFQALAAVELLQVSNHNIVTLEEHLAIANASQRSGISTRFNVLRIEALLEEARAEKRLAEDNALIARKNLSQAMGLDSDERALQGTLPAPDEKVLPVELKPVLAERDDIRAQLSRQGAAEKIEQAAAGFWWPRLALYADEQYYKYKAFDPAIIETPNFKEAYTVGARLSWDIFDGGASLARQAEAGHRAEEAAQVSRAMLLKAALDFETWQRRFVTNAEVYRARLRTEEKSQESVRLATLGLKAGTNTNSEVLDAELDLFRSRANIVRAQSDAAEALINLELAIGKKL
jgi:outer membrane protein TolC